MKYLIKPTKYEWDKWVIAKDNLSIGDVRRAILNSELFVSDLDDSIAHSPTRAFVKKNFFKNPLTLIWGAFSLLKIMKMGKKSRFEIWRTYFTRFERDLAKIEVNIENAAKRLYPGITEFFGYLEEHCPHQKQILITRTVEKIGMPYQAILGFDRGYYRQFDKYKVVDELVNKYSPKIISIAGDSEEDKEMVDRAKASSIEYCLGINVAGSMKKINEGFDINIGRNWKGLQEIINGRD
ncbi:hypothetical protein J4433_03310 [Candidatus Pacearchaeota archaeon]|nr:hypothetical protein [Candidatus Pacearchaeota archaeon]